MRLREKRRRMIVSENCYLSALHSSAFTLDQKALHVRHWQALPITYRQEMHFCSAKHIISVSSSTLPLWRKHMYPTYAQRSIAVPQSERLILVDEITEGSRAATHKDNGDNTISQSLNFHEWNRRHKEQHSGSNGDRAACAQLTPTRPLVLASVLFSGLCTDCLAWFSLETWTSLKQSVRYRWAARSYQAPFCF